MCQSKADGGRRCAFHLEQGVSKAMTSYAAAVTGLPGSQVAEAYASLEREGLAVPTPSREEVDAFLAQQAFQVRYAEDLTESRRRSLLARLQAALGRITPNGATFHAWKNLVAESFARVRRRAAAAFLAGALTFSVGACGNVPEAEAPPAQTPVATAPAAPAVPVGEYDTGYDTEYEVASQVSVGRDAEAKYGAARVAAAMEQSRELVQDYAFNPEFINAEWGERRGDLLRAGTEHMTPDAAKDWRRMVRQVTEGTPAERDKSLSVVYAYTFYAPFSQTKDGTTPVTDGPAVVNPRITSTSSSLDSYGRLKVEVKSVADVRLLRDEVPTVAKIKRTSTFYLVPSQQGWKVDGWVGSYNTVALGPEA